MTTTWPRVIAHADMDAFYASVEQLDDPSLRGRRLIVGPNSLRGVVLTASYEARKTGVKSAMPMAEAMRRCPDALVVPPRFDRYQEQSKAIMNAFADFSPSVEAISLDEAFIDMTGAEGIFGTPANIARLIRDAVTDATGGLTASVGIAATKYVAKVASDFNKPNGITVVSPEETIDWLNPLPVSRLWGAGPKTVPRFHKLGLLTIGDVRRADAFFLKQNFGNGAAHFQALANGQDPRRVSGRRKARSIGSERTLLHDVSSRDEIEQYLKRSADRIGRRLRDKGYRCGGVRVKLKTNKFKLLSRQSRLTEPSDCADHLYKVAADLLSQFEDNGPYRLVGLAAYELSRANDPQQVDMFATDAKPKALENAIDDCIKKFGKGVISRAADLGDARTIADTTPTLDFIDAEFIDPDFTDPDFMDSDFDRP